MNASVVGTPLNASGDTRHNLQPRYTNMEGFNSLDLYQKSETLKQQSNYVLTLEKEDLVSNFIYGIAFIEQCFDEELRVVKVGVAPDGEMIKYLKKINLADVRYPTVV